MHARCRGAVNKNKIGTLCEIDALFFQSDGAPKRLAVRKRDVPQSGIGQHVGNLGPRETLLEPCAETVIRIRSHHIERLVAVVRLRERVHHMTGFAHAVADEPAMRSRDDSTAVIKERLARPSALYTVALCPFHDEFGKHFAQDSVALLIEVAASHSATKST